ncbi:unnamed protein product, partial [Closterium sp. Naga37s-1]
MLFAHNVSANVHKPHIRIAHSIPPRTPSRRSLKPTAHKDPAGADDRGTTRGGSAAADGHGGCSHYDSADAFLEGFSNCAPDSRLTECMCSTNTHRA